jgi:mono/diheme cytochrome c family protein
MKKAAFGIVGLVLLTTLLSLCGTKREIYPFVALVPSDTAITYNAVVGPLLTGSSCAACHGSGSGRAQVFATYAQTSAQIDRIIARAQAGTMPPPGYLPLTAGQIDTLRIWRAEGKPLGTSTPPPIVPIDTTIGYAQNIAPLLAAHCGECHIGDSPQGGVSLATLADVKTHIDRIIARTAAGTMPPAGSDFSLLTSSQVDTFRIWKASGEKP